MTWLFTQVWLWSLAAFALGSLLTWLLFVLPLRKRLRAASEQLSQAYQPESDEGSENTGTALDLFPASSADDEPTIGDWERGPRSWTSRRPEPPAVRVPAKGDWEIPDWAGPADTDTGEVEAVTLEPSSPRPFADERAHLPDRPEEPEQPHAQRAVSKAPLELPSAPASSAATSQPVQPESPASQSSWFQNADIGGQEQVQHQDAQRERSEQWTEDVSARQPSADSPANQLKSLFEPRGEPDPDAARREPDDAESTQHIPRIDEPAEGARSTPLPRRTPGAGPKPGAQNLNSVAKASQEPTEPAAEVSEPSAGEKPIKGHFASLQYHTPDSPQYDRVVAQAWFSTPTEAEQAGFERWDARSS